MARWVAVCALVLVCLPRSAVAADLWTQFTQAVEKNDLAAVTRLLDKHPKLIHATDEDAEPAIHVAVAAGHLEMVRLLLSRGTSVELPGGPYATPLHTAAQNGRLDIAKLLISKGAKVNAKTDDGSTTLWYAVDAGSRDVAKLLIEHGAQLEARNVDFLAVLHPAAQKGDLAMCRLLIEKGAKVDGSDARVPTPLMCAVAESHPEVAHYLVEKGADVNAERDNRTPLSAAIWAKQAETAELLLAKGARLTRANRPGYLFDAIQVGDVKLVEVLIAHGADVNERMKQPVAYHPATATPPPPMVRVVTPLELALGLGKRDIAEVLRKHGAAG